MTKKDFKARETLYKGIRMRSRLEADCAAFLDRNDADWEYEPVCFAGPQGQWLPDFRVMGPGGRPTYMEVKPESYAEKDLDPVLERMTVAWLTEPDAVLHLAIWYYGEPLRCFSVMGFPRDPDQDYTWWMCEGAGDLYPWPGMRQLEQTVYRMRAEQAEEARRARAEQQGEAS